MRNHLRWLALILLVLLPMVWGCMTGTSVVQTTFPILSSLAKAGREINDSDEYFMGRAVGARLLVKYPLYQNATVTEYVNEVGQTVARKSSRPNIFKGYHFGVLDTQEINAFTCPGGTIFITRGLLTTCANEEQLAAVLAHEVSHVINKDGINSISEARWTEVRLAVVKKVDPTGLYNLINSFSGCVDAAFISISVNGYSRTAEEAADAGAVVTLTAAGYDPGALAAMLTTMLAKDTGAAGGIYKTHPPTSERLAKLKTSVGQSPESKFEKIRTERFKKMVL